MARHRRSLEDLLADAASQNRANAGVAYSTPAMAAVSVENLDEALSANIETLNADLATINSEIESVDDRIAQAIDDSLALPLSDERFQESSLTIWPFIQGAVPIGALAPGAVGSDELADFSLVVRKFKDDRHRLY